MCFQRPLKGRNILNEVDLCVVEHVCAVFDWYMVHHGTRFVDDTRMNGCTYHSISCVIVACGNSTKCLAARALPVKSKLFWILSLGSGVFVDVK